MDGLLLLGALQHVADVLVAQLRRRLAVALDGAVAREAGGRRRRAVAGGAHLVGLELAALELLLDQLLLDEARGVAGNTHYWLRPETVESYFYLWRITKDPRYREWAWDVVQAIERECRCGVAYCGLKDVDKSASGGQKPGAFNPTMESFFLAETLKYLWLIFSDDDVLPLDRFVFNTEAHPLPVQRA